MKSNSGGQLGADMTQAQPVSMSMVRNRLPFTHT
jgi:hypothetical protein